MKQKIVLVLLVLLTAGIISVSAVGQSETEGVPYGPRWQSRSSGLGEKLEVTGELYFENRVHPELKSGDQEYELMVPRFYTFGVDLKEGQTITVEGYQVEGPYCTMEEEEDEIHLWVSKAVIDGKEYDLDGMGFGKMGRPGPFMRGAHPMGSARPMGSGRVPMGSGTRW